MSFLENRRIIPNKIGGMRFFSINLVLLRVDFHWGPTSLKGGEMLKFDTQSHSLVEMIPARASSARSLVETLVHMAIQLNEAWRFG